ncbi:MAG: hypothetical protein A3A65_00275 [Candidatus Chisholmbacteria bacterium RIFCSPLOWO2_01_FULL_49_14]|uniref:Solute-binding protein family 5 domain-containing protein n=1 Tax=Candidatus Chisholmbacteria bacterium RIFCSPLOWO2_01_FULL_49_14 TaxID=1797593 RepID=A0A1G1W1C5_9BACT|nr:MAG: hypothetical protein A3A65_00275 [Candidatus Chisholmbacteria bacterium RIFCSPLOWO2_01_FULL_49_14]
MLKKIRFAYWMLRGFFKRHNKLLFIAIFAGLVSALLVPKIFSLLPKTEPLKKIAIIGKPILSELPLFIQNQISYGLTSITPSGEAQPSLAKSMSIEEDGRRYRFVLRDDLFWHDGKPFKADDVNYNFSDVTITVVSDTEVVFDLKEPFSPFPTVVSQPLFRSSRSSLFPGRRALLGLGPMRVKNIVRNAQYITELSIKSDQDSLLYRFYNNQEAAVTAFKLGEVDEILELSSPGELVNWPNTIVSEVIHPDRYVALFFNVEDPNLSSKSLRQALTYAIPDKGSESVRAVSPINPDSWAHNPQVKPYDYDPEAAKRLLDSEREQGNSIPQVIELTTTLPYLDIAENIKEVWSTLGINTTMKVATFLPENFQVLLIAQEIPPDPDQYSLWHSTQQTNLTRYNSPKVDKLLEDGRQTIDKKERILIYQDFQRFLVEDSPAAFLFHHRTFTITRS